MAHGVSIRNNSYKKRTREISSVKISGCNFGWQVKPLSALRRLVFGGHSLIKRRKCKDGSFQLATGKEHSFLILQCCHFKNFKLMHS
jgi:hypothetical protein